MAGVLAWLSALPPFALYLALGFTAALENFFPPIPADTIVAFGAFLAARGEATAIGAFLATWLGRRYGADEVRRRIHAYGPTGLRAEQRFKALYIRYGIIALFLSRFLPGVRALVPPFAGAMRMPLAAVFGAVAVASGIWYGVVTVVAYRVGSNWELLRVRLLEMSRGAALVAGTIVILLVAGWFIFRALRRR